MHNVIPRDEEIVLDSKRYIVSKTDTQGYITYANDYFVDICGYSEKELLGQPHNIIRHPDMPRVAFQLMWNTIKDGKNFKALVKNLAKDGRYYWVLTSFETQYDPLTKAITGYTAYRKAAPKKAVKAITPIYERLLEYERLGGMEASAKFLNDYLMEHKTTYNDFVESVAGYKGLTKIFFETMKKLFG